MRTTTRRQQPFGKSVSLAVLAVFCLLGGWLLAPLVAPSVARQRAKATASSAYATQNIEDIAPGQTVLAVDPATGRLKPRRVVQTFVRTADHLRVLEFEDATGRRQSLKATDEHPFWLPQRAAFVAAGDLEVGDTVTGPAGELQSLSATVYAPHPGGVTVYNFEVEDYHTYFVAHGPRGPPVLVHNADYPTTPDNLPEFEDGSFSIIDWRDYPDDIAPRPQGPFRLLEGEEYKAALDVKNTTNRQLHIDYDISGLDIHETTPVKFGGSPTDHANKMLLDPRQHWEISAWWSKMQRAIEGTSVN